MPDRETTLELLRRSSEDLARETAQMPDAGARWRPKEGEWSVHECLAHLRDIEQQVFLERIRRMVREDRPRLEVFDEVAYHRDHYNPDEPIERLLADFAAARAEIVSLLAGASDWTRGGAHATRGPITMEWQADYALGHTWEHMSQMLRVRLAYELANRP
jgi:hypothetical protein